MLSTLFSSFWLYLQLFLCYFLIMFCFWLQPPSGFWSDCSLNTLPSNSPEQSSAGPAAKGEHQTASADLQSTNQRTVEKTQVVKEEEEKNLDSTPEKPPPTLAPPQLAQLRTENADSFDMEEVLCSSGFYMLVFGNVTCLLPAEM